MTAELTAHRVLISLVMMVVIAYIAVELAGMSSQAGDAILLFLIGLIFLAGISYYGSLAQWESNYPFIPSGGTQ